jgi:hypothetical protein
LSRTSQLPLHAPLDFRAVRYNAKRGAWRLPACFVRSRRDAEGVAGGAHRKSGVKTASISDYSARWSHTNSSVRHDYKPVLLPRTGECNRKILRAERAQKSSSNPEGKKKNYNRRVISARALRGPGRGRRTFWTSGTSRRYPESRDSETRAHAPRAWESAPAPAFANPRPCSD